MLLAFLLLSITFFFVSVVTGDVNATESCWFYFSAIHHQHRVHGRSAQTPVQIMINKRKPDFTISFALLAD